MFKLILPCKLRLINMSEDVFVLPSLLVVNIVWQWHGQCMTHIIGVQVEILQRQCQMMGHSVTLAH